MEDGNVIGEVSTQSPSEDGSEGDLGDEHERRPASLKDGSHGAQVDFGLTAAGHPMHEKSAVGPFRELFSDSIKPILLSVSQSEHVRLFDIDMSQRIAPDLTHEDLDQSAPFERANDRTADLGGLREFREGDRFNGLDQPLDDNLLLL